MREVLSLQNESVILDKKRKQQEGKNILIESSAQTLQLDKIPQQLLGLPVSAFLSLAVLRNTLRKEDKPHNGEARLPQAFDGRVDARLLAPHD